jgi:hypothetical protein
MYICIMAIEVIESHFKIGQRTNHFYSMAIWKEALIDTSLQSKSREKKWWVHILDVS